MAHHRLSEASNSSNLFRRAAPFPNLDNTAKRRYATDFANPRRQKMGATDALVMFLALIVAHALADYPLQGDFLSRAKNRHAPIPGAPWYQAMTAHAAIHGGAVALVTHIWWLGLLEFVAHFVIDDLKCRGKMTFDQDQLAHVLFKLAYVAFIWAAAS